MRILWVSTVGIYTFYLHYQGHEASSAITRQDFRKHVTTGPEHAMHHRLLLTAPDSRTPRSVGADS